MHWDTTVRRDSDGNACPVFYTARHEVDSFVLSLARLPRAAPASNISLVICLIHTPYWDCDSPADYCGITERRGFPLRPATPQLSRNRRFGRIQRPHQRDGILPDADNAPPVRLPPRRLARWPVQDGARPPGARSLPYASRTSRPQARSSLEGVEM